MGLGRNYLQGLTQVMRSMEDKPNGFWTRPDEYFAGERATDIAAVLEDLKVPTDKRLYDVELALRLGASVDEVYEASGIDPWFLEELVALIEFRQQLLDAPVLDAELLREAKAFGLSDAQIAALRPELAGESGVRQLRWSLGITPTFKTVDTCSGQFDAKVPYLYSAYELDPDAESEVVASSGGSEKEKVIILGSGPNRIGQGIEFDYSCVHAALELSRVGYETVMVNCNPETVSTDYDTADRLYFEPLTFEDVMEIYRAEAATGTVAGVIVQLGGQTPLGLAQQLEDAGVPVVGTSPKAIDMAEDRGEFGKVLDAANLPAPAFGTATTFEGAREVADRIGYPVLVDRFLDNAIEIDVDVLCDGTDVYLGGVMEHIEEAGIHSGDSACALPPMTLGPDDIAKVRRSAEALAHGIGVEGLMNVQFALKDDILYVIEANPRASRTVPFVSKATGVHLAKAAARIMMGATIAQLRTEGLIPSDYDGGSLPLEHPIAVKEAVLPFTRFRRPDGALLDTILGPEMKSTGEVMGLAPSFGMAYAKAEAAAFGELPTEGTVFVSLANRDKRTLIFPIQRLSTMGFKVLATEGTAQMLRRNGIECEVVLKGSQVREGAEGKSIVDRILDGEIDLVLNTPAGSAGARHDGYDIRAAAVIADVAIMTTVQGVTAAVQGIEATRAKEFSVTSLQELEHGKTEAK